MKKNYKIFFVVVSILLVIFTLILFNGKKLFIGKQEVDSKKLAENDARQKVEYILESAKSAKENDSNYNSENFLTELFKKNNSMISGNIASYGGYNFQINRDDLSISESLGSTNVSITDSISEILDRSSAMCLVKVNSNINIDSIVFENTDGTLTTENVNNTSFEKEIKVIPDKTYSVSIVTSDGKISLKKIRRVASDFIPNTPEYGDIYAVNVQSSAASVNISSKFPSNYASFTLNNNFITGIGKGGGGNNERTISGSGLTSGTWLSIGLSGSSPSYSNGVLYCGNGGTTSRYYTDHIVLVLLLLQNIITMHILCQNGVPTDIATKIGDGNVYYLGTGTSYNLAALAPTEYKNFTANNFICLTTSISSSGSERLSSSHTTRKLYAIFRCCKSSYGV